MKVKSFASRHLHLSLSNFEADPYELTVGLSVTDLVIRRKGDLSSKGQGRPARNSTISVLYGFDGSVVWDDAFAGLVGELGGIASMKQFLLRVGPVDQHIHFQIPARGSLYQDNNYLSRNTLDTVQDLKLWIGFDFSDYDPSDPTHLDPRHGAE